MIIMVLKNEFDWEFFHSTKQAEAIGLLLLFIAVFVAAVIPLVLREIKERRARR